MANPLSRGQAAALGRASRARVKAVLDPSTATPTARRPFHTWPAWQREAYRRNRGLPDDRLDHATAANRAGAGNDGRRVTTTEIKDYLDPLPDQEGD